MASFRTRPDEARGLGRSSGRSSAPRGAVGSKRVGTRPTKVWPERFVLCQLSYGAVDCAGGIRTHNNVLMEDGLRTGSRPCFERTGATRDGQRCPPKGSARLWEEMGRWGFEPHGLRAGSRPGLSASIGTQTRRGVAESWAFPPHGRPHSPPVSREADRWHAPFVSERLGTLPSRSPGFGTLIGLQPSQLIPDAVSIVERA